jgi:predicted HAD superfamily phosphohydrolase YqeG
MAPPPLPDTSGLMVSFTARAGKPNGPASLIAAALSDPRPTAVCGDQPMTDGRLAQRLGGVFFYWQQPITATPIWPLVQRWLGDRVVLGKLRPSGEAVGVIDGRRR